MAGAFADGFLADRWVKKTVRGRIALQALGVFAGAPFVILCGKTQSVVWLAVALSGWGFFKGLYDANIFGIAPIVVGFLTQQIGLGAAIAATSFVYLLAASCLLTAMAFFLRRDIARLAR